MKLLTALFSILTLGAARSQVSFYVSADAYLKASFNSANAFEWDAKPAAVSDWFSYQHSAVSLSNPVRAGLSAGVQIGQRHSIEAGIHQDGVSSKSVLRFASFQQYAGVTTPVSVTDRSRTAQSRIFLSYKYAFLCKPGKTTLAIVPSVSIGRRAGGNGVENVGSFGTAGTITRDGTNREYYTSNTDYTANVNRCLQFGIGLSSDLYFRDRYWITLSLQYSHSKSYLYYQQTYMELTDSNNGQVEKYLFSQYNRASGIYFGVSRHFTLLPWKL